MALERNTLRNTDVGEPASHSSAPSETCPTVGVCLSDLDVLTRCPICWDRLKQTKLVKKCMHRFCSQCIDRHLRGATTFDCPLCMCHLPSRRELVQDKNFDQLLRALYQDVDDFDAEEMCRLEAETTHYFQERDKAEKAGKPWLFLQALSTQKTASASAKDKKPFACSSQPSSSLRAQAPAPPPTAREGVSCAKSTAAIDSTPPKESKSERKKRKDRNRRSEKAAAEKQSGTGGEGFTCPKKFAKRLATTEGSTSGSKRKAVPTMKEPVGSQRAKKQSSTDIAKGTKKRTSVPSTLESIAEVPVPPPKPSSMAFADAAAITTYVIRLRKSTSQFARPRAQQR